MAFTIITIVLLAGSNTTCVNGALLQFTEAQLTSNSAAQQNPDIDGIHIVYQDNRSGDWNIYMFTLQGTITPETQITTNPANQTNPRISGDTVVYQDDRNGNWDIYAYNVISQTETQITNDTSNQGSPDIDGTRIVWDDNRGIGIYDLSTKNSTYIAAPFDSHHYQYWWGGREYSTDAEAGWAPKISGNRIVYQRTVWDGWYDSPVSFWHGTFTYSYCFDLSTNQETLLTPQYTSSHGAVICDNYVAWVSNWQGSGSVSTKDLTTSVGRQTTNGTSDRPAICENQPDVYYIVYQDNRNGAWSVFLYNTLYLNTDSPTEYKLPANIGNQMAPAVSDGRIVYMDDRNGNWDVYLTTVGYVPETISAPPRSSGLMQQAPPPQNQDSNSPSEPVFTRLVAVSPLIAATLAVALAALCTKRKGAKHKSGGQRSSV